MLGSKHNKRFLVIGVIGTAVTAICCFTPALVVLLGAVGLTAWLAWLDYVLIPALALFMGLTVFALIIGLKGKKNDIS